MKRNISRWALTLAFAFTATNAFAQDEEGEPAETEEAAEGAEGEPAPEEDVATEADTDAGADAAVTTDGIDDSKFFVGLRLGYSIPLGKAGGDEDEELDLSFVSSGQIPIWLDLGYRVTPNLVLGLYGSYAFGFVGDACVEGADCSANQIRFGVQGQYHLSPGESFNPWFGLGIGYEILNLHFEGQGSDFDESFKGFEFANLQVGGDFKVSDSVGIGPFVSFSLGQYSSVGFGDSSEDLEKKTLHEWLTIGARGAFNL